MLCARRRPAGRRHRRRLRRRELRARVAQGRSAHRRDAGRSQCDLHGAASQQRGDRRAGRAQPPAVRLRQDQERRRQCRAVGRDRRRSGKADGDARRRHEAQLRAAGGLARHRFPRRRDPGLRPGGDGGHAAGLQRRRAGCAAAAATRSHGGRRHRRDLVAGQSGALPAGALRARQPDRALSENKKAEIQSDRARRQGKLHHAEAVRGGMAGALSRHDRMGRAVARRRADVGRCRGENALDRLRQIQGRGRATSSRRRRPDASPSLPASPTAPAGARSIR